MVCFSNAHGAYSLHNKTLNINSTGAKTINIGFYTNSDANSGYLGAASIKGYLFVYTGSVHYIAGGSTAYADHSYE